MSVECDKCGEHCLDCCCMKQCIGFLGIKFGHSFRRYLVKEQYKQKPYESFNIEGLENVREFMESQRNVYIVRCKRCGFNAE